MWYSRLALFVSRKLRRLLGLDQYEAALQRQQTTVMDALEGIRHDVNRLAYMQARVDDLFGAVSRDRDIILEKIETTTARLEGKVHDAYADLTARLAERDAHASAYNHRLLGTLTRATKSWGDELKAEAGLLTSKIDSLAALTGEFKSDAGVWVSKIDDLTLLAQDQKALTATGFDLGQSNLDSRVNFIIDNVNNSSTSLSVRVDAAADQFVKSIADLGLNLQDGLGAILSLRETDASLLGEISSSFAYKMDELKLIHEGDQARRNTFGDVLIGKLDALHTINEVAKSDCAAGLRDLTDTVRVQPRYVADGMSGLIGLPGYGILAIPTTEVGIFNDFYLYGTANIESGVRAVLLANMSPDAVVVDIGASVGLHSLAMGSRLSSQGKLYSFEPNRNLWHGIEQTYVMNGLVNRATLVRAAVAEHDGKTQFYVSKHSPLSTLFESSDTQEVIDIETIALDSYFKPGEKINLMKIDAEGAEPAIWRGMPRLLSDNPDIRIVIEFASSHFKRAGEDSAAFLEMIADAGFKIQKIAEPDGALLPITSSEILAAETSNLLLTRQSH